MGLVLDSSVLIAAERERRPVSGRAFRNRVLVVCDPGDGVGVRLALRQHTRTAARRRRHLDEVLAILPVEPFTREMAVLAARIDAGMK